MSNLKNFNGVARVENLDKPVLLLCRELGYRTLILKGFDNLDDLRKFMTTNISKYTFIKRFGE